MRLFKWEKSPSKERFEKVEEDFWKLEAKFVNVCNLLRIGFSADNDYPTAYFIDKTKKDSK